MEGRRKPTRLIIVAVIVIVLIGWMAVRYAKKRRLIHALGNKDVQVRVDAAQELMDMGILADSLPVQPIIVRSKTAEALGEIGTDDAIDVLAGILEDEEEAPRRWARRALVKQGERVLPVLLSALSSGGGATEQAIIALKEIGPQTATKIRFFLADGNARDGAAEACAEVGGIGTEVLLRACYNPDDGLRRAALTQLGLRKVEAAVEPALFNLLPIEGSQKGTAIKALGIIGDKRATMELIPFLDDEYNREAAVTALGQIGDRRAVQPIVRTLNETEKRYRNAAILALRRIGEAALPTLVQQLDSDDVLVRRAASAAMIGSSSPKVNSDLALALEDPDAEVRASAASALGWKGNVAAVPTLVRALSDSSWQVVDAAVNALGAVGVEAVDELLRVIRRSEDVTLQFQVSRALAAMGDEVVPKLDAAASERDPSVRKWSVVALGEIGNQRAVEALKGIQETAGAETQWVVEDQLRRLAGVSDL